MGWWANRNTPPPSSTTAWQGIRTAVSSISPPRGWIEPRLDNDGRGIRGREEPDERFGRGAVVRVRGHAGGEHAHPLHLRRQRPDVVDAGHRQQFGRLLETEFGVAARHHGADPLPFDAPAL